MDGLPDEGLPPPPAMRKLEIHMQRFKDAVVPYTVARYFTLAFFIILYWARVFSIGGFYVVTYALGIYLLKLLVLFVQPLVDPESEDDEPSALPSLSNEREHRPFVGKMSEFKVWTKAMQALAVGFTCTFFRIFDLHVFWPMLLFYFLTLFFFTAKKQIMHMWKHKYIPFNVGKKRYQGGGGGAHVREYEK